MVRIEWKSNFCKFRSRPLLQPVLFLFLFYFKCLHFLSFFCRSLSLQYPLASLSLCLFCSFVFFAQLFFNKFLHFFFLFCFFSPCFCFILCLFFLFFLLALASLSTYSIVYLFPCLVCPFVSLLSNRNFFFSLGFPLFDSLLMHVTPCKRKRGTQGNPAKRKAKTFFEFCLKNFARFTFARNLVQKDTSPLFFLLSLGTHTHKHSITLTHSREIGNPYKGSH